LKAASGQLSQGWKVPEPDLRDGGLKAKRKRGGGIKPSHLLQYAFMKSDRGVLIGRVRPRKGRRQGVNRSEAVAQNETDLPFQNSHLSAWKESSSDVERINAILEKEKKAWEKECWGEVRSTGKIPKRKDSATA